MKTAIDAMKQALKASQNHAGNYKLTDTECDIQIAAETALQEAIAAEEAKPPLSAEREELIAVLRQDARIGSLFGDDIRRNCSERSADMLAADAQRQAGDEITIKCYQAQIDDLAADAHEQRLQTIAKFGELQNAQQVAVPQKPISATDETFILDLACDFGLNKCEQAQREQVIPFALALLKAAAPQPPLAERVQMTDDEINSLYQASTGQSLRPQDYRLAREFARAVEARHGIR